MSDLPFPLGPGLAAQLDAALDAEGKIVRALEALGPVGDRDVLLVDASGSTVAAGLAALGARLVHAPLTSPLRVELPDESVDAVVSLWSGFRGVATEDVAEADRLLRPSGRLLVVHDYGRDDVSRLQPDRAEFGTWSRRNGPFLTGGFRVRVLHCFWTFESAAATAGFLETAFGEAGSAVAQTLKRPRLSYNVAVYHRARGGEPPAD